MYLNKDLYRIHKGLVTLIKNLNRQNNFRHFIRKNDICIDKIKKTDNFEKDGSI